MRVSSQSRLCAWLHWAALVGLLPACGTSNGDGASSSASSDPGAVPAASSSNIETPPATVSSGVSAQPLPDGTPTAATGESPAMTGPAEPSESSSQSADFSWSECGRVVNTSSDPLDSGHPEVRDLAISADGSLLMVNGPGTQAWRVAPEFQESSVLWTALGTPENGHVAVSPDGRFATISGDVRVLFDAQTGEQISLSGVEPADPTLGQQSLCLNVEFKFSADGRWVAGKQYTPYVDVYDTSTLELVAQLETPSCGQGISFSPDGSTLATPEGLFSTTTWAPEGNLVAVPDGWQAYSPDLIEYSAAGGRLLRTSCRDEMCRSTLGDVQLSELDSAIEQRHVSPEGDWVIAGNTLLHWSSGAVGVLQDTLSASIFAPNGDVIGGMLDGGLVRYCRSE